MRVHFTIKAEEQNGTQCGLSLSRRDGPLPWTTVTQRLGSRCLQIYFLSEMLNSFTQFHREEYMEYVR